MMTVFEEYRHEAPETILSMLKAKIDTEAKNFIDGLRTEDQFYINTYSSLAATELLKLYGVARFDMSAINDLDQLKLAKDCWAQTGRIEVEPWMEKFIKQKSIDISEAMNCFFEVTDKLLVPLEYFMPFSCFSKDFYEKYPKVLVSMNTGAEVECFLYFERCLDFEKLTNEDFVPGKQYVFHFEDGTQAEFTTKEFEDNKYSGEGIIEGYMSEPGCIVIENDKGQIYFQFNFIKHSEIGSILGTQFHAIPHPKWEKYNKAVKAKQQAVGLTYKELRKRLLSDMMHMS